MAEAITKVKNGLYRVREGDDYTKVALLIYGDRHKAVDVATANPQTTWEPGSTLTIPNKPGVLVVVPDADTQFPTLYRAVHQNLPTAGAIKEFQRWNGGSIMLSEGDLVFFPDMRPVNYGY